VTSTLPPQGRASDYLAAIARAATLGAVDPAFVDIDQTLPGFIDEAHGALTLDDSDDAANYGVVDEIARRVLLTRARARRAPRGQSRKRTRRICFRQRLVDPETLVEKAKLKGATPLMKFTRHGVATFTN
jgi:hypothetical protein